MSTLWGEVEHLKDETLYTLRDKAQFNIIDVLPDRVIFTPQRGKKTPRWIGRNQIEHIYQLADAGSTISPDLVKRNYPQDWNTSYVAAIVNALYEKTQQTYQKPVTFDDVLAAQQRLRGIAHETPVITSRTLDGITGRSVFLKCENLQRGGAFKFRGAYNTISQIPTEARERGVLAYSSGNHAQGVALAAQLLGIPAVICMPNDAPAVKVAATRGYGAEVIFYNRLSDDREAFARNIAEERGMSIVPPYDHPQIMAGAGTAALELMQQVSDLDTVLLPIGGGGLIGGSGIAIHGANAATNVYGVEPADADDTLRSLRAGERQRIAPPATIADGLRVVTPGALTFPVIQQHVKDVLTVTEEEIYDAMRFALLRLKLVVEPSGAVPLAAALAGKLPTDAQRVGLLISGGNADPAVLAELWG